MSSVPVISVIIAAHNAGQTIEETLDSLTAQHFPYWEAIIVDDGSNDDTANIVKSQNQKDRRFRLISTPWQGLPAARNTALDAAVGKFIHCLDADDTLEPDFYEAILEILSTAPRSQRGLCAVSGYRQFYDDGETGLSIAPPERKAFALQTLVRHNFGPPLCFIFERAILEDVGCFDEGLAHCHDWDLWLRFARQGVDFIPVYGFRGRYRIREGSLSRSHVTFLDTMYRVIMRTTRQDVRVNDPIHEPLESEYVIAGLPALWHYSLLKAVSENNSDAMLQLFGWGKEHLPLRFWTAPWDFGVQSNFQWTERKAHAPGAVETKLCSKMLSRLYLEQWPAPIPQRFCNELTI